MLKAFLDKIVWALYIVLCGVLYVTAMLFVGDIAGVFAPPFTTYIALFFSMVVVLAGAFSGEALL